MFPDDDADYKGSNPRPLRDRHSITLPSCSHWVHDHVIKRTVIMFYNSGINIVFAYFRIICDWLWCSLSSITEVLSSAGGLS